MASFSYIYRRFHPPLNLFLFSKKKKEKEKEKKDLNTKEDKSSTTKFRFNKWFSCHYGKFFLLSLVVPPVAKAFFFQRKKKNGLEALVPSTIILFYCFGKYNYITKLVFMKQFDG